jgi:hypothetical protein
MIKFSKNRKQQFVEWLKNLFKKPFKPGLPPDARPKYISYEVGYSIPERIAFTQRVYEVIFPPEAIERIKTEQDWADFKNTTQFREILDKSEVLTKEEIDNHYVQDWDYLTKGWDEKAFLAWAAAHMERYLQKDGDVCMLPDFFIGAHSTDDTQIRKMGLMNVKGKIKPFIAGSGEPAPGPMQKFTFANFDGVRDSRRRLMS